MDGDQPLTSKEASVTVVDWIDERTSLSGATRWLLFRNVDSYAPPEASGR
jgi:hypothetical protein